jgi:hypothetical protein
MNFEVDSMIRKLICLLTFLAVGVALTPSARADEAIGYLVFNADNNPLGEFDVVNQTGINSSGDATWPVSTQLHFSGLSLSGISTSFALDGDGVSWDGSGVSIAAVSKLTSVTLTGTLTPALMTLFDSSTFSANTAFTATLTDATGIKNEDLVVIYATTGSSTGTVPEPESLLMVATGCAGLAGFRRRLIQAMARKVSGRAVGATLGLAAMLFITAGAAQGQVKLNT